MQGKIIRIRHEVVAHPDPGRQKCAPVLGPGGQHDFVAHLPDEHLLHPLGKPVLQRDGDDLGAIVVADTGCALIYRDSPDTKSHSVWRQSMNQFFDKLEVTLRQALRTLSEGSGSATPTVATRVLASALILLLVGRLHRFAYSGFKRLPSEHRGARLALML